MTIAQTGQYERTTQADFEAFYSRTARTLHGYLCRLCGDSATADEVLQETYIRMLNAPAMDDLPRKGYLYKTATNLLRDRWRKQKREQKLWEMSDFTEHVHQKFNLPMDMASCLLT
ncbi:MAG TPA: RNA polymerase sigma factor [Candidatus Angelobacter sp.]|jgi:RNA polymerase sigma-70 factor (ECF subfamily)